MEKFTVRKLKIIVGCALVGSVLTGTFLGWVVLPFDLHIVGATVGALVGAFKSDLA